MFGNLDELSNRVRRWFDNVLLVRSAITCEVHSRYKMIQMHDFTISKVFSSPRWHNFLTVHQVVELLLNLEFDTQLISRFPLIRTTFYFSCTIRTTYFLLTRCYILQIHPSHTDSFYPSITTHNLRLKENILRSKTFNRSSKSRRSWYSRIRQKKKLLCFIWIQCT